MKKKLLMILGVVLLVISFYFGWLKFHDIFGDKPESTENTQNQPIDTGFTEQQPLDKIETNQPPNQTDSFNKNLYSVNTPGSLWWVVNRQRPLPSGYVPSNLKTPSVALRGSAGSENMQLRSTLESDLVSMFSAAKQKGNNLVLGSGYRSEATQTTLYNNYVASYGKTQADRFSARPGTSEHQTGLSFDITTSSGTCYLEVCFGDTPEGKWIKNNAHFYGFIIRYPKGKENITGYQYEPWHLRYVGRDLATELFNKNTTMEEFFGIDPVPFP